MTGASFARWRGSPNHYQGRRGLSVNHITLHIMVGRLAGTDSCFQRADFRAASHYGVGSVGEVWQWVDEADGSWADANWRSDCSGITIEHEGGMAGIPVTDVEVEASARLCADIARRHGWKQLVHDASGNRAGNVWLHREVPGTDHFGCPDRCVNGLPVDRLLARANQILGGTADTTNNDEEDMMQCIIQPNGENRLVYFDGQRIHNLSHPDQVKALQMVAEQCGHTLPCFALGSKTAPWATRLEQALK